MDRVPDELWNEVRDIVQETGIKTIPMEKKCKKAKWLSEEASQIAVKRREGFSVSISGNNVLVGAIPGGEVGQAHLFDATTGALLKTFDDPTVTTDDQFGFSVSISGNNVLVGAPGDDTNGGDVGQAHLFDARTGVAVGGEIIPLDSTALLLAGAQTFSWMIPVVFSILGIGLFVVSRKSE